MKALLQSNNLFFGIASRIERGIYDEPDVEKWALYDENDNLMYYGISDDSTVVDFDPAIMPEDYEISKYFYIDGKFTLNPDWVPAPPTIDERVEQVEEEVVVVANSANESEEALCDIDEYYSSKIKELEDRIKELEDGRN